MNPVDVLRVAVAMSLENEQEEMEEELVVVNKGLCSVKGERLRKATDPNVL